MRLMLDIDQRIATTEAKLKDSLTHDPQRIILENQLVILQTLRKLLGQMPID